MLTHTRRVVAPEELKKGLEWADSQGDSFRLVASTQLRATCTWYHRRRLCFLVCRSHTAKYNAV